ncbi:MAG: heavy metal transport/detoxification protein [Coprobacter sp.]|nr:heavy metal transport/detoxification protein [Coprobacter sp.]
MKTCKFKTNAKCGGCVAKIESVLNPIVPRDCWSIDLSTPDRILTITGELSDEEIIGLITSAGFKAEKID